MFARLRFPRASEGESGRSVLLDENLPVDPGSNISRGVASYIGGVPCFIAVDPEVNPQLVELTYYVDGCCYASFKKEKRGQTRTIQGLLIFLYT